MKIVCEGPAKASWNKGKIVGQKAPLKLKDIWAIRIRLQLNHRMRELALFDLGLDSKLRACDLVKLRVKDICHGDRVSSRAIADIRGLLVSQSNSCFAASWHQAVRSHCAWLGQRNRLGSGSLWNAFHATDQAHPDLPTHQKPSSSSAVTWAHQNREHRKVSGN